MGIFCRSGRMEPDARAPLVSYSVEYRKLTEIAETGNYALSLVRNLLIVTPESYDDVCYLRFGRIGWCLFCIRACCVCGVLERHGRRNRKNRHACSAHGRERDWQRSVCAINPSAIRVLRSAAKKGELCGDGYWTLAERHAGRGPCAQGKSRCRTADGVFGWRA